MKTVLITGVNGFLGSHLASTLNKDFEVIGLVRDAKNIYRIKNLSIKIYSSKDLLENIFIENKIFAVIHTATVYKQKDDSSVSLLKTNVELPLTLAELISKYNAKVFLNTDSFFNNTSYSYSYLSEYTLTKKQSLDWLKLISNSKSFKLINMKIFHMYGDNDSESKFVPNLISEIKNNVNEIRMTEGNQTRDFIYIKDVVAAYRKVLLSVDNIEDYQEYHIGTGLSTSIKNFTNTVKTILNSKSKILFGAIPYRTGEIMESKAENANLTSLGWKPEYSLERGLKDYIN